MPCHYAFFNNTYAGIYITKKFKRFSKFQNINFTWKEAHVSVNWKLTQYYITSIIWNSHLSLKHQWYTVSCCLTAWSTNCLVFFLFHWYQRWKKSDWRIKWAKLNRYKVSGKNICVLILGKWKPLWKKLNCPSIQFW